MIPPFILSLIPPPVEGITLFLAGAGLSWLAALWGTHLRDARGWPVAYTRKVFHFIIFTAALGAHWWAGWPGANAYGSGVMLAVVAGLMGLVPLPVYRTLARERDAPHEMFYIVVPMLTTAAGGMVSNLVAGPYAMVGYLVTGWGDAVGEPAGRRFGRRFYRVPGLLGETSLRSVEGSTAVLGASMLAALVALAGPLGHPWWVALVLAVPIGVAGMVLEAASPHGSDNFTTMVGPAWLASVLAPWLAGAVGG